MVTTKVLTSSNIKNRKKDVEFAINMVNMDSVMTTPKLVDITTTKLI